MTTRKLGLALVAALVLAFAAASIYAATVEASRPDPADAPLWALTAITS